MGSQNDGVNSNMADDNSTNNIITKILYFPIFIFLGTWLIVIFVIASLIPPVYAEYRLLDNLSATVSVSAIIAGLLRVFSANPTAYAATFFHRILGWVESIASRLWSFLFLMFIGVFLYSCSINNTSEFSFHVNFTISYIWNFLRQFF